MTDEPVKVGDTFGKWRVRRLYTDEETGTPMADVVNTRNTRVSSQEVVTDLPRLGPKGA